ncbi:hypothetical protein ACSBR2_029511 [Camellia fascicularis]
MIPGTKEPLKMLRKVVEEPRKRNTYAEVVKGGAMKKELELRFHVVEYGNEWLFNSLVVKLRPQFSFGEFKEDLQNRGLQNIEVKEGGGRLVYVTFQLVQAMRSRSTNIIKWVEDWCETTTEWEKGLFVNCERLTWLYCLGVCLGVPPNLWNSYNFKKIGELWGEVVAIHDETLSFASLKYDKVKIITSQLETID